MTAGPPAGAISPAALASLADLLDGPLVLVDAGCRWGASEGWEALLGRIEAIGSDPDEEECARLNAAGVPGRRYVPFALGARTGTAPLHLTAEPACSSLYTRLDEWLRREGVGRVDALKLDVQGSELAALEGTGLALEGVRAVETEVTFNRIYPGQPLLADIERFLRARGFVLWRLRDLVHYGLADASSAYRSPERHFFDSRPAPMAAEGGRLFWANAFSVPRGTASGDAPRPRPELVRDALVASAMSFPDLARRALGRAPSRRPAGAGSVGSLPPRPGG